MSKNQVVIIPVYDQILALSLVLHGFQKQAPPYNNCLIIVVDDGSTEPVESIVESYKPTLNIQYIKIPKSGRAAARNIGAKFVKDGLIIFCDADRIPRTDFIKTHVDNNLHYGNCLSIGQIREMYVSSAEKNKHKILENYHAEKNDRNPQYFQLVRHLFASTGESISRIPWISTFSGNMSIPVQLFHELGGFDESFKEWGFEHFELGYRAYRKGVPFRYIPDAINVHLAHPRMTSYVELIQASHSIFYKKHKGPVIEKFLDFMLGKISLLELEQAADVEMDQNLEYLVTKSISDVDLSSLYLKITNTNM